MKVLIMICFMFIMSAYADRDVIRGTPVLENEAIAKSTVGLKGNTKITCSGVLVAKNVILTAAHCVANKDGSMLKDIGAVFGTSLTATDVVINKISTIHVHPDFTRNTSAGRNDIALVYFEGDAPPRYKQARLLKDPDLMRLWEFRSKTVLYAGYGRTEAHNSNSGGVLNKGQGTFEQLNVDSTEISILQDQGSSTCKGDSGGPLYLEQNDEEIVLLGVDSRGRSNCDVRTIFSSVAREDSFLENGLETLYENANVSLLHGHFIYGDIEED